MASAVLVNCDYELFGFLNSFAGKSAAGDFIFIALAEWVMYLMIAGLALFVLLGKKNRVRSVVALQAIAAAFISRAIIVSVIRLFISRARPFVAGTVTQLVAHNPMEGSFPSGHTSVMFALAFTMFFADSKWGVVYLFLALASAISRIVVGVHFPLDIVGGILAAALATIFAKWFIAAVSSSVGKRKSQSKSLRR